MIENHSRKAEFLRGTGDKADGGSNPKMVSGVTSASSPSSDHQTQPAHSQPPAKPPASSGQDSVQLSSAAKASGDVDHDGDSK